ncbi:hypothetical protein BG61_06765 [Caballeronia glathei]|uniref:Uncharacterized protein n=1 Tax=Caballeronia glathei TaxID=60547 RepID=A0A069PDG0_9BURK|nr:hypothetical protein BG61_06765 [Caballeronia glathei]
MPFYLQLVADEKFPSLLDRTDRSDEHSFALLFRLAIRRATMIKPTGRISTLRPVDHAAVVQVEEESVAVLGA